MHRSPSWLILHKYNLSHEKLRKVMYVQANGVVENSLDNPPPRIVDGRPGVDHIQAAMNDLNTTIKLTDFGMSTRMDTKCRCRFNFPDPDRCFEFLESCMTRCSYSHHV